MSIEVTTHDDENFFMRILFLVGLRKKTYLVGLTLVAWFLFALVSGEGLVLCFGDDGHVAVETSANETCRNSLSTSGFQETPHSALSSKDEHPLSKCGACLDIPLSSGKKAVYSQPEINKGPQHTQLLHRTCSANLASATETTFKDFHFLIPFPFHITTALLSSTILLI